MIGGIEYILLLALIHNGLPLQIFSLRITKFFYLDICVHDKTMAAPFYRIWVCCREGDISNMLFINVFTGGDMSDWKTEAT